MQQILLLVPAFLLTACDGSGKSSIWGKERGIGGVWEQEKGSKLCEFYNNCGGDSAWGSNNSCDLYGNCGD